MMSPARRRVARVLALALAGTLAATSPATAATEPQAVTAASAANTVQTCIERTHHLLVYVQIDRSGSIHRTDPNARRVDGVTAALLALSELRHKGSDGQPVSIDVLLGSFAGTVEPTERDAANQWVELSDATLPQLGAEADRYADRDHDTDTDYVLALRAARRALDDRDRYLRGQRQPSPCKVLLFVTDGRYRLSPRTEGSDLPLRVSYARGTPLRTRAAVRSVLKQGRQELCAANTGLMDKMDADGIVKFTVAFSASKRQGRVFDDLHAFTTGVGGHRTCGAHLSAATGRFIFVKDLTSLFIRFRDIFGLGCPHGCRTGQGSFVAERGLSGFVFSAAAPVDGLALTVTDPTGTPTPIPNGDVDPASPAGTRLTAHWAGTHAVDLTGRFAPRSDAWIGHWQFAVTAPEQLSRDDYGLRLRTDLRPTLVGDPQPRTGTTATIRVQLVAPGDPAAGRSRLAQAARLEVLRLVDAGGEVRALAPLRPHSDGTFETTLRVPADAPEGDWHLRVGASFAVLNDDVPVRATSATFTIPVAGPTHFPLLWVLLGAALLALAWCAWRLRNARFTAPRELNVLERTVVIAGGEVSLLPPTDGALGDFSTAGSGRTRRPRLAFERFVLRSRGWLLPGGRAHGRATARGRWQLVCGTIVKPELEDVLRDRHVETRPSREDRRAYDVAFELGGTWLFALDPDGDGVQGELIVFAPAGELRDYGAGVLEHARTTLARQDWAGFGPDDRYDEDELGVRR